MGVNGPVDVLVAVFAAVLSHGARRLSTPQEIRAKKEPGVAGLQV
jgi:hypothetical protein